jgi:hypothetical protein
LATFDKELIPGAPQEDAHSRMLKSPVAIDA